MPRLTYVLPLLPAQAARCVLVGLLMAISTAFAQDNPPADAPPPASQAVVPGPQTSLPLEPSTPSAGASEPSGMPAANTTAPVAEPAPSPAPVISKPAPLPARPTLSAPVAPVRPAWTELTKAQQQALLPLSTRWSEISEAQRRKWIALSQNFDRLLPDEREKLHNRMTDWASLSVQQRNQARLNFAATNKLAPDDKKAQWEAYQALSPEEREKLATGARPPPPGAALAIKPVPSQRMVVVPRDIARKDGPTQPHSNPTLLPARPAGALPSPTPVPVPAPARTN